MLFNSVYYLLFFPCVVFLYFLLPGKYRWVLLLLASCYFYAAFIPKYIIILFFLILVDYVSGILIDGSSDKKKKIYLLISLFFNIGTLFIFKYFNFFNSNISNIATLLHWNYPVRFLELALPIGLSFHTFQSLSYVIEVYKRKIKAERHLGRYALYVMFFPQLVAGPIERPQNLLPQLHLDHIKFEGSRTVSGLRLMLWGFIKKMVIADNCALVVNHVFSYFTLVSGMALIISVVLFAFQIYCDFSGYSDIARGSARVLGINLMRNFNLPYLSTSINDFWRRWHISLFSWFKDYIYIPLGGNRHGRVRQLLNILIVFFISGLWHGANWTFIMWGGLNGLYQVFSVLTKKLREKVVGLLNIHTKLTFACQRFFQTAVTFLLVCIGWVFFRADSLADGFYIISHMFVGIGKIFDYNFLRYQLFVEGSIGVDKLMMLKILLSIGVLLGVEFLSYYKSLVNLFDKQPMYIRWGVYYTLILSIFFFGYFGNLPFIYFQF